MVCCKCGGETAGGPAEGEEEDASGGPFTDAVQVQEAMSGLSEKEKQARLKKELQFAREICTTLPSVDPLFRIQVTLPNKRRQNC